MRHGAKQRAGGLAPLEQRVLDGDSRALRALVRQAASPNTLEVAFGDRVSIREVANGTGSSRLQFDGYASVTDREYELEDWLGSYVETVNGAAFQRTLSRSPDVIFCFNHGWDAVPMARTIAGTVQLASDSIGLRVDAQIDPGRADVYALRSAMDAGEVDAMSFAFWVTAQEWDDDFEHREILEVDLDGGDVSVVTWPANPFTAGMTGLRSTQARALMRTRLPSLLGDRVASERRSGSALSQATENCLRHVLDLVAAADDAVDKAQPLLAQLLGVPNPDSDHDDHDESLSRREAVSDKPWSDFGQSDYNAEQWHRACLIHLDGDSETTKSLNKLPVREPDGTLNRNGCHAAAGRIHSIEGVPEAKVTAAAKALVALYHDQLKEDPPDALTALANRSARPAMSLARLRVSEDALGYPITA